MSPASERHHVAPRERLKQMRQGNRIRVTIQLIRGATDEHFWSETYNRELRDVFAVQSELAQSIAQKVRVTATGKDSRGLRQRVLLRLKFMRAT